MLSDLFPAGSFHNLISRLFELSEWSRNRIFNRTPDMPMMMNHTFRMDDNLHKPMAKHANGQVRLEMSKEEFQAHVDDFMRFNTLALNNEYENFGTPNRLEGQHREFFQELWESYETYNFTEAQQLEMTGRHDSLTCELCQGHLPQLCKARKA
jgi:hypothetical protein